jgi:hypothetical protein
VQVGTSSRSPVSRGTDYAFISVSREPAYCPSRRFAGSAANHRPDSAWSLTPKGSVVTGPYLVAEAEGFPRHHPPSVASSLNRGSRCGLRRYERVCTARSPSRGARFPFLTRQGISLELSHMSPYGSDHIFNSRVERELAGVWPLRIPGNETAFDGSWSARSPRCGQVHPR